MLNEKHLIIIYDLCLLAVCGVLSYFVTPWALAGMLFMAGWKNETQVEVEQDGAHITVTLHPDEELSPSMIREAVKTAMEEADGSQ